MTGSVLANPKCVNRLEEHLSGDWLFGSAYVSTALEEVMSPNECLWAQSVFVPAEELTPLAEQTAFSLPYLTVPTEYVAPSAEDVAAKVKDIVRGLEVDAEFSPLRTHTVPDDSHPKTFTVLKIILPARSYGKEAISRVYEALGEGLTEDEGEALSTWVIPGE